MTLHWMANVGRHDIRDQRKMIQKAARLAGPRDVGGFCEIGEGDGNINEPDIVRDSFPKPDYICWGLKNHVPIIINKEARKILYRKTTRVAEGRPGVGPHRYVTEVGWQEKGKNGWAAQKYARLHTHTHAGAWNNQFNRHDEWRKQKWIEHWNWIQRRTKQLQAQGYCVVLTGDMNRPNLTRTPKNDRKPHSDAVLVTKKNTDEVWAIPSEGKRVKHGRVSAVKGGVDFHKIIRVDIRFVKA